MKKLVLLFMLIFSLTLVACQEEPANIQIYTRDTTSGTREAFFSGIDFDDASADNTVLAEGYVEVDGNGSMMSSVTNDVNGIGYISLSGLADSGLTGLSFEGVVPTVANVLNDSYTLKRPFMYMTRVSYASTDEEDMVEAFLAYMNTTEGKAVIANKGGIVETSAQDQHWNDIKGDYPIVSNASITLTLKFGGSTSVESVAKALTTAFVPLVSGNLTFEHNHTGSGDAYKRTQGSEKDGANMLHVGFLSRGVKADSTEPAATGTYDRLAWDAVVVVVNPDNSYITNITAEALKSVYNGTIVTWDDLAA